MLIADLLSLAIFSIILYIESLFYRKIKFFSFVLILSLSVLFVFLYPYAFSFYLFFISVMTVSVFIILRKANNINRIYFWTLFSFSVIYFLWFLVLKYTMSQDIILWTYKALKRATVERNGLSVEIFSFLKMNWFGIMFFTMSIYIWIFLVASIFILESTLKSRFVAFDFSEYKVPELVAILFLVFWGLSLPVFSRSFSFSEREIYLLRNVFIMLSVLYIYQFFSFIVFLIKNNRISPFAVLFFGLIFIMLMFVGTRIKFVVLLAVITIGVLDTIFDLRKEEKNESNP